MAIDGNDPKEVFQWYTPNPGRLIHSPREDLTVMNIYHVTILYKRRVMTTFC
jgi:hypothetical protein